jgi:oligopeptide/dipeptide ABC transporter ATP-binding protein
MCLRVNDALLAFPDILLAIFILSIAGVGSRQAALAVGIANIPWFIRLGSTLAASIAAQDYVANARVIGVRRPRLLVRYILSNMTETVVVATSSMLTYAIIAVSALSFLGLGVQPPSYDWGQLLSQGLQQFYTSPMQAVGPAIMIAIGGVSLGLLGDALARTLNPVLWTSPRRRHLGTLGRAALTIAPAGARHSTAAPLTAFVETVPALRVEGLSVSFPRDGEMVTVVQDVSFNVAAGEIVGVVGESGSGKSITMLAIGDLVNSAGSVECAALELAGRDLRSMPRKERQLLLAKDLSYIFQDPGSSLNPALRIGTQMTEGPVARGEITRREARTLAASRLADVHISAPGERLRQYPHELSGGMKQRVMIATALLGRPKIMIADEPTTALDVTVQAQVLSLLQEMNARFGTAIILVSHNLAVVANTCSRIIVMYAGRIVEDGVVEQVITKPRHPYTRALIGAIPDIEGDKSRPLVAIKGALLEPDVASVGCPFADRCPSAFDRCRIEEPPLVGVSSRVACWLEGAE